ncbi:MAG: zinc-binding dehydrogenase, partial [Methanothrix sp.]|nr:zinc-binding dehydrogenase [Methanothrix sp.]
TINPRELMGRDAAIFGMLLWNLSKEDAGSAHATIRAGLEQGVLNPVIAAELPLAEAAQAHRKIMEPGALGKIVLIP